MTLPYPLIHQEPAGKPVHPGHKATAASIVDSRPVTEREGALAFRRVTVLFQKADGLDLGSTSIPDADRPLSRSEIVGEMDRIYRLVSPKLRFTPAPVRHDASLFRIDPPQRPALERLVNLGCVAKIGPLAVGPSPSLTPKDFGDALGFFMARVAQMNHLPSPKWTPMLKGD